MQTGAATLSLRLLYDDAHLVVVDKPAGLLVHKSLLDKHETQFLLQQLRDQTGDHLYPVHRLDKPTSGAIVFAKSAEVAAALKLQMDTQQATKEYLLVCRGYCPEAGVIDYALKPLNDFKRPNRRQKYLDKPAQEAITEYWRLATFELAAEIDKYPQSRFSLVRAQLKTGRKHQLRRHFKHLAHPIIGCPKYGKANYNRYFAEHLAVDRLLLHAHKLSFTHPVTQQLITVVATPNGHFQHLLERFDWWGAI